MVDDGAAVDGDLQAVVGVVVLGRLVIGVKLEREKTHRLIRSQPASQQDILI